MADMKGWREVMADMEGRREAIAKMEGKREALADMEGGRETPWQRWKVEERGYGRDGSVWDTV